MMPTTTTTNDILLFPILDSTLNELVSGFDQISDKRKEILKELAGFIQNKVKDGKKVYLNFICTHNSRRSVLAQCWAQAAAYYYAVPGVECFSGGTDATAFNPRAVVAMQKAGFEITKEKAGENPIYEVRYSQNAPPIITFSKKYNDPFNQNKDFAAIMTCSHADENCPLVTGASTRIALPYNDPKEFDGTPIESIKYSERANEIGREMLFTFYQVKK